MSDLSEQVRAGGPPASFFRETGGPVEAAPSMPAAVLPASPWIVRGETLAALRDAEGIRSRARQDAERLVADAARAAQRIGEEARRQGVAQGMAETGRLLTSTADAVQNFRAEAEAELVPLAFAIAHRILGSFPEDERLRRAVDTALDEHRLASGLRLRVNPADAAGLRAALAIDLSAADHRTAAVIVEAVEDLPPGSCTLIHPRGRAAVGPIDQLRILFAAGEGAGS